MQIKTLRLIRSIYIDRVEETYLTSEKYKIDRDEDDGTFTVQSIKTKDTAFTPTSNAVYWK